MQTTTVAFEHADRGRPAFVELVLPTATAAGALAFPILDGRVPSLALAAAAWLFVYGSYAIDRISERDPANRAKGTVVAALALIASFAITGVAGGPRSLTLLLVFPLSVALYGTPLVALLVSGSPIRRLKDIPYFKNFYTAFFWGLFGVFAALFSGIDEMGTWLFAFLFCAIHAFVNNTYCDVKDVARDRADGVRTIVGALGIRRTLVLLQLVNLAGALVVVPFVALGIVPRWALGLCLSGIHGFVVLAVAARPGADHERLAQVAMDIGWLAWTPILIAFRSLG